MMLKSQFIDLLRALPEEGLHKSLVFWGKTNIDESWLEELILLPATKNLTTLRSGLGATFSASGLRQITRAWPKLENLSLRVNKSIRNEHLKLLTELPELWALDLSYTSIKLAQDTPLPPLPKLTSLELQSVDLNDAALSNIVQAYPKLESLDFSITAISDEGLKRLKPLRLISLQLVSTGVTDDGLKSLREMPLRTLDLSNTKITDRGLETLAGFQGLSLLKVRETKITEAAAKKLAAALPRCKIEWNGGVIEPKK